MFKTLLQNLRPSISATMAAACLLLFGAGMAQAQNGAESGAPHCVSAAMMQRNAAQIYMVRLTDIAFEPVDDTAYRGARLDTRGARMTVLKVYRGDVDALKDLEVARLVINCVPSAGMDCRMLQERQYPFYPGQMLILYDRPDEDGVVTIKVGPCPGSQRYVTDAEQLAFFEHRYPPQWESDLWIREHEAANAPQDSDAGSSDPVAADVNAVTDDEGGNNAASASAEGGEPDSGNTQTTVPEAVQNPQPNGDPLPIAVHGVEEQGQP